MRRIIICMVAMVLGAARLADAVESVGRMPNRGHLRFGLYARSMTIDELEYDNREYYSNSDLDHQAIRLQYGVTDALHFELQLGQVSWQPDASVSQTFDDGLFWGWGLGGTIPVYQMSDNGGAFEVCWNFQYNRGKPDDLMRTDGSVFEADVEWWQSELAICANYLMFHGFAGIRYAQADLTYTHDSSRGTRRGGFQEADPWGGVIGGGVHASNGLVLQGEFTLGDISGFMIALMMDIGLPEAWVR